MWKTGTLIKIYVCTLFSATAKPFTLLQMNVGAWAGSGIHEPGTRNHPSLIFLWNVHSICFYTLLHPTPISSVGTRYYSVTKHQKEFSFIFWNFLFNYAGSLQTEVTKQGASFYILKTELASPQERSFLSNQEAERSASVAGTVRIC